MCSRLRVRLARRSSTVGSLPLDSPAETMFRYTVSKQAGWASIADDKGTPCSSRLRTSAITPCHATFRLWRCRALSPAASGVPVRTST